MSIKITVFVVRRVPRNVLLQFQKLTTTASVNSSSEIQVPMRKERGPTDILEVLGLLFIFIIYLINFT